MRVLLAVNDPALAARLRRAIEGAGGHVLTPRPAAEVSSADADLAVVDLDDATPPTRIPTLLLGTARSPGDYLPKPFSVAEFLLRMGVTRRCVCGTSELRSGDLAVSVAMQRVSRGGRRIDVAPRELHVLHLLMSAPGRIFTRVEILDYAWEIGYAGPASTVDATIRRLRAKLDDHFPVKRIRTVRGKGYMLTAC